MTEERPRDSETTLLPAPYRDDTLRPSDRLVVIALAANGGDLTLSEVRAETGLPDRTARDAAERLEAAGYLDRRKCAEDPRRYRWVLV